MAGGLAGGSVAEAALEAWVDCKPEGYVLLAESLPALLPSIAARIPNRSPGERAAELGRLFSASHGETAIFLQMLKPFDGKVHFLYFWKAFSEAARIAGSAVPEHEGLSAELEMLRDRVLRQAEEAAVTDRKSAAAAPAQHRFITGLASLMPSGGSCSNGSAPRDDQAPSKRALPMLAIVEEVHRAASMSSRPQFWRTAAESLNSQMQLELLSLDTIASVLLSWLHDVARWESQSLGSDSPIDGTSPVVKEEGLQVLLHVYDVSQEEGIQKLNRILAHKSSFFKLGGVFHAGVEVNGLEWSFGFSMSETHPGVSCVAPKKHPQHHYRQTVVLKPTYLKAEDVADIISNLIEEYPGDDYDLLRRNCCHFADDFSRRLGVGGIPNWVIRLARIGASVDSMLQASPRPIKERLGYSDDYD